MHANGIVIKTFRRLRSALGNGLVWGAAWFASAFVAYAGLGLLGAFEGIANPLWVVLGIALNVGTTGFRGGALRGRHRGRHDPRRSALAAPGDRVGDRGAGSRPRGGAGAARPKWVQ